MLRPISKQLLKILSGQHVPVLHHPQGTKLPALGQIEPSVFQFVFIDSTKDSLALSSFVLSSNIYRHQWYPPKASLGRKVPTLTLFPNSKCSPVPCSSSWSFAGLSQVCPCPLHSRGTGTIRSIPCVISSVLSGGRGSQPLTMCCLMQSRVQITLFAKRVESCSISFNSPGKCSSSRCRTLPRSLLNIMKYKVAHLSSLLRSLLMAS